MTDSSVGERKGKGYETTYSVCGMYPSSTEVQENDATRGHVSV